MAEYLTVTETAALLDVSERAIQKNAMNGKYGRLEYISGARGGACGKVLQIPLAALPPEAQGKYISTRQPVIADEVRQCAYDNAPEWQREIANFRQGVIKQYQAYMMQPGNKTELTEQFVEYWNGQHLKERISRSTLYNKCSSRFVSI